jgi:serine protease Do
MRSSNQLRNSVAELNPQSNINLEVIRHGAVVSLKVQLGQRDVTQLAGFQRPTGTTQSTQPKLGISVRAPDVEDRQRMNISVDGGVIVTDVASNSMAAQAGIQPGDLIVSVGGIEINTVADYQSTLASGSHRDGVRMRVYRNGVTRFAFIKTAS